MSASTDPISCSGAVMCIGGPALVIYVSPTEEELVARYNPELRKRSLENRAERMEDYDRFVSKLKEYSKSDKPSKLIRVHLQFMSDEHSLDSMGGGWRKETQGSIAGCLGRSCSSESRSSSEKG